MRAVPRARPYKARARADVTPLVQSLIQGVRQAWVSWDWDAV